ncbi:DNA polymerase theta-like [Vanessa tameamea]|uniref:DNA-directed DNA polymerase n=1 Tax=Vanessa tameamea TaxID=334116 RepID=A0ABM4AJQ4_VANTA
MMLQVNCNEIDLQKLTENVSFLADCFDNSFALQSSLNYVKECAKEINIEKNNLKNRSLSKKWEYRKEFKHILDSNVSNTEIGSQLKRNRNLNKKLNNWGLPREIANKYELRGITEMFDWQVDCLANPKILSDCRNLLYSAPTSAGKTLVAEILTIKTVLERQKKVIIILPFVSIVREKMFYLQDILSSSGIRVEGFMGSQSPPGGLQAVHVAICTIEKANSLINKLLEEGNISELGAVVVDELHLLGDPHRGYILELLLTKIKYVSLTLQDVKVQIVGMSATLPNLGILASWLDAELFITEFRPIPLNEYCLVGNKYYDKSGQYIGLLEDPKVLGIEGDYVLSLCLETLRDGCSILIFCMTKNWCENLAQSIASSFYKLGCSSNEQGMVLREQLKSQSILETLEQLKNCPVGLDQILKNIVSFGVAYHHAGLTFDERDIIEGGFKSGAIRVLVATSTLSSGVNLPARKVIIRSPVFQKQPINILSYKQMVGRAGRMGKDIKGESVLICTPGEQKIGFDLMMGNLEPVKSCIENEDKFMRAILEMIASKDVCKKSDLDLYTKCTLLFNQECMEHSQNFLLGNTLKELVHCELIRIQNDGDSSKYVATSLGRACLSSSMAPNDGLSLFCELQKARQCLVLETDLHLIYLVTPYSVSSQWNNIDWLHLLTLWESLTAAMKRVGELVGVQESFIIRCLRGTKQFNNNYNKLNIHKRFYTALALQDLVNEVPLSEVSKKFQCARGFLQGLQQASSTFAGMVTAFCHQLGWKNMEMLISQFQDRLQFGIHSELLELMKLSSLNGVRARTLFDAGFETISSIASAAPNIIENCLHKSIPFQSEKEREGDDDTDVRKRNKMKNIWITGFCGMTTKEAAENLILEARKYLEQEIGVAEIKWKEIECPEKNISVKNNYINKKTFIECIDNVNIKVSKTKNQIDQDLDENSGAKTTQAAVISKDEIQEDTLQMSDNTLNDFQVNTEVEILDGENVHSKINETDNMTKVSLSPVKQELVWDSLNVTDAFFDNISKLPTSDNFLSPNISFGIMTNSDLVTNVENNASKSISSKDISLFSSDGDNSSIFEDSLPFDLLPNTIIDDKKSASDKKKIYEADTIVDYVDINSKSILNVFKSPLIDVDEDDDFKLVYEDDKISPIQNISVMKISQENEIGNTQEFKESFVESNFKSPRKRHAISNKHCLRSAAKKSKKSILPEFHSTHDMFQIKIGPKSKNIVLKFANKIVNCYILNENDNCNNFFLIEKAKEVSIILDINSKEIKSFTKLIGSNIFVKPKNSIEDIQIHTEENLPVKGIALYLNSNSNICLYFDIMSLKSYLPEFKNKLKRFFSNARGIKLRMLSTKAIYLHIKKWLETVLLTPCCDITLGEWLLDSDEKTSRIMDFTKKYCNVDLFNTEIFVNDERKRYNDLESHEKACLHTWCLWNISEEQIKSLEKYSFINKILDTEIQVSKILADCEYYGITVDKDLASRLLIDVKSSQEVLQNKAFKLCGYHFNFNSSKDVAKVLGLYKGRKISTKKSVLTAHNSTMASIVIYWRKLNSILTKTLYPLTQQAVINSRDNRISPSYTMHTCTGRISMHEPNLQNVPRTFSIPLEYLAVKDYIEPCGDVIEFNCRNIFKATPGYVFVSADYCQLEMRILTHYSKDAVLTSIMCSNVDVFKSIAASWSGVADELVDDDLRQKAKQLCYGILYGMGNKTLAQYLDLNEIEAAMFMDTFYNTYPAIKVFTQKIVDECRKNGYIETLMKRRRYLPDITSNMASKRGAAERQAINTTIQGSAADIAKAAMCAIDTKTSSDIDKPRLILQMHDELIYEVIESKKDNFVEILKSLMEETVRLNVPLPVKVKIGYTWGAMQNVQ